MKLLKESQAGIVSAQGHPFERGPISSEPLFVGLLEGFGRV